MVFSFLTQIILQPSPFCCKQVLYKADGLDCPIIELGIGANLKVTCVVQAEHARIGSAAILMPFLAGIILTANSYWHKLGFWQSGIFCYNAAIVLNVKSKWKGSKPLLMAIKCALWLEMGDDRPVSKTPLDSGTARPFV